MSQSIRGENGNLIFPIGPKNAKMVEDVEILLPVKLCLIPFSCFREEVENMKVHAGRTDDGRTSERSTHYDNSSLEPSAQVN